MRCGAVITFRYSIFVHRHIQLRSGAARKCLALGLCLRGELAMEGHGRSLWRWLTRGAFCGSIEVDSSVSPEPLTRCSFPHPRLLPYKYTPKRGTEHSLCQPQLNLKGPHFSPNYRLPQLLDQPPRSFKQGFPRRQREPQGCAGGGMCLCLCVRVSWFMWWVRRLYKGLPMPSIQFSSHKQLLLQI